jgi:hypothetical protein
VLSKDSFTRICADKSKRYAHPFGAAGAPEPVHEKIAEKDSQGPRLGAFCRVAMMDFWSMAIPFLF